MSEKRFIVENDNNEVSIKDKVKDNYPFALAYEHIDDADNLIQECLSLVVLLNEQQATINNFEKLFSETISIADTSKLLETGDYEIKRMAVKELIESLQKENEQLILLLKEAEEEIDRLKKSNQGFMESLVNNESEKEDNQETEVRECQFCGEFRTEYHEYDDYSWSAEDYCNAGHDLEDTNPNSCKDYWDND